MLYTNERTLNMHISGYIQENEIDTHILNDIYKQTKELYMCIIQVLYKPTNFTHVQFILCTNHWIIQMYNLYKQMNSTDSVVVIYTDEPTCV